MTYTYDESKRKLKVVLDEEIDVNSCKTLRTIIDGYIMRYSPKVCELDMAGVTFMDSSGIGFISGRQNLANMINCKFILSNVRNDVKKIIQICDKAKRRV